MSKRPVIGVIPLMDYRKQSYWMLPGYFGGISEAGGFPVMLPLTSDQEQLIQAVEFCNGFLFTGGQDVTPSVYNENKTERCGECCPERDTMEAHLLDLALQYDKPILGICRGIQFINAALGGSLWQDIPSQHPSKLIHCQKPPYDKPIHDVNIEKHSPLYEILHTESLPVNSYHHQAVKELSPKLKCMAQAPDGLIEAIYAPEQSFLWAVQWHPEFSYLTDENSRKIFRELIIHCD
ncbi:MAG TPA: gamma-glutamyl-gamma-aminobutyrate hydrolase family protein [Ruminococcus sp.]|nr:gamma-glutamyl-gamma-aminobutyrate hydrolase family protein [Ruminococcus sp.]